MTTAMRRRTVAEMEKRLADARRMIESMRADAEKEATEKYPLGRPGHDYAAGRSSGLDSALYFLTACFDDPERDWMYRP